jgi:hypothetical protein
MIGDDPELSDREKYLQNPNYVTEYVGSESVDIVITFSDPSVYFDVSRFDEGCSEINIDRWRSSP